MIPPHTHKKHNPDFENDNYHTVLTFKIFAYTHGFQQKH